MKISLQDNPVKPGTKRIVVHPGAGSSFDDFVSFAESSTVRRADVLAVMACAEEWITRQASNGREVDIAPVGRSRLGMRGKFKGLPEQITENKV